MLVIGYKKKHLNFNLVFGLIWLSMGLLSIFWEKTTSWIDYGYFIFGFLYLVIFYFKSKYKYLTITDDVIQLNQPFGWKVEYDAIREVKFFSGDYIIKTAEKEYTINGDVIDPKMKLPLDSALRKLIEIHS